MLQMRCLLEITLQIKSKLKTNSSSIQKKHIKLSVIFSFYNFFFGIGEAIHN